MNKIIEQVLEFLECDNPRVAIKEFLEDELRAIDKEKSYFGLKDISNKKIYADCSIVELEIDEDFSNDHFTSTEPHKFIGVVRFDYLGARVEDINDKTTIWFYEIENNEIDIKIIDTIQENKLGLIKLKT